MRNILTITCCLFIAAGFVCAEEKVHNKGVVKAKPLPNHAPKPHVNKFVIPKNAKFIKAPNKLIAPTLASKHYWKHGFFWKNDLRWWRYDMYWSPSFAYLYTTDPNFYQDPATGIWFRFYNNAWFAYNGGCWYQYQPTGWEFAFRVE